MILEAKNLTFSYEKDESKNKQNYYKNIILKNYHLQLKSGEILGLMAPSGQGKTTLCKLLAGYEKPQEGELLLDGKPYIQKRGYCPVQMIWQHGILALDPRMRMKDSLREGGAVAERVKNGLGLREEWMDRFPAELSGGELQRFCIARALGPDTKFLLADEMTAMLDLISQCRIWKFLRREMQERELGILAVSHDEGLLKRIADRILAFPADTDRKAGEKRGERYRAKA